MVGIDKIEDKDQLRQVAQLLDRENEKLHAKVREQAREIAALFYSLIESAKLCSVDPKRYLREAAVAAIRDGQILLPRQLQI